MEAEKIARINALAKKAKTVGLTDAEAAERRFLRAEYLAAVRSNLERTLENAYVLDKNGHEVPIKKQKG